MRIDAYSFGSMTVEGRAYPNDIIIFPDRILDWWREEGHVLSIQDLEVAVAYKPQLLIVGSGDSGCLTVPGETRQYVQRKGICLIVRNTAEAYPLFNDALSQDKKVVGAFHLTC